MPFQIQDCIGQTFHSKQGSAGAEQHVNEKEIRRRAGKVDSVRWKSPIVCASRSRKQIRRWGRNRDGALWSSGGITVSGGAPWPSWIDSPSSPAVCQAAVPTLFNLMKHIAEDAGVNRRELMRKSWKDRQVQKRGRRHPPPLPKLCTLAEQRP
jgi:hypothetical protein